MTRPRLELAIGVTGHRASNLAGVDLLALRAAVSTILAELESALRGVGRQHAMAFDAAPPRMRLVSALADGADTLVAQAALAAGWRLDVCLPFVREEYAKDFELGIDLQVYLDLIGSAGAVMELPGRRADAAAAYEAVGRLVLEQSDILIALWDGDPDRGRGGTSRVVAEAIARLADDHGLAERFAQFGGSEARTRIEPAARGDADHQTDGFGGIALRERAWTGKRDADGAAEEKRIAE